MCKSIVEHLLRVTCPNRAGRQSRMLWAGGVPAEVAWPAPTLKTPLSLCQPLAGHPFSPEQGSLSSYLHKVQDKPWPFWLALVRDRVLT